MRHLGDGHDARERGAVDAAQEALELKERGEWSHCRRNCPHETSQTKEVPRAWGKGLGRRWGREGRRNGSRVASGGG